MKTTILLAMLCASCASTTISSTGHVHVGNVAGNLEIARITTPSGAVIEGWKSSNMEGAKNAGSVWFWTKFWSSSAVNDIAGSTGDAITTAVKK